MAIKESGEMYLETILVLSQKMEVVRAIDVVKELGYSKPSVSRAMSILKNDGFIKVSDAGAITLTAKGRKIAETIYERHNVISDLLEMIGVSKNVAIEDACRVEHYISEETFDALRKFHKKKEKK
ncbi:MAG: metal-dependent transcriptional regulator [Lachnospiraceae bacterium]|nr:metal-dependent transcriptional regulator [Lachnospiraceae bacterium]